MSKALILAQVVEWLHNDEATPRGEEFWSQAKDAIQGDVYGIDLTVPDWDLAHCVDHPSLWFYAALSAGHVWTRDTDGLATASRSYQQEVGRVGTSPQLRGVEEVTGQMARPYGA